jgi:hypothetical protein
VTPKEVWLSRLRRFLLDRPRVPVMKDEKAVKIYSELRTPHWTLKHLLIW